MGDWLGYLLAFAALAVLAPAAAWFGRRHGRSARGTAGLAMILLGFGQALDPPKRPPIEAAAGEEDESAAPGEPKGAASGG